MVNHAVGPALREGHVQCVEDEVGFEVRGHRPADDPAPEDIQHDGEIGEPGPGRNVRDVGHPDLIRRGRDEVPLDEIRRGRCQA